MGVIQVEMKMIFKAPDFQIPNRFGQNWYFGSKPKNLIFEKRFSTCLTSNDFLELDRDKMAFQSSNTTYYKGA